jgi:hypothetical protein
LVLFSSGAALVRQVAPWLALELMPDNLLLDEVSSLPDAQVIEEWREVERRKLPTARLDALADPLLKKRARYGPLVPYAEGLLYAAMTRPGAAPSLVDHYFGALLSASLAVPDRIDEGERLEVRCVGHFRGQETNFVPAPDLLVLSSCVVAGDPDPPHHWEWPVTFATEHQSRLMQTWAQNLPPGPARVHQRFWLVTGPAATGLITWSGAQPVLPPGRAVIATYDIDATVEVVPTLKKTDPPREK